MDYFGEYPYKGLPSPADTPYETPDFIRSKRSSRATMASSREDSRSPPPLPPDAADLKDKQRDARYGALDPRRFTPTLHASLVSEILNLRRELDSKNSLVENLEHNLSAAKTEVENTSEKLSENAREVRRAKLQVQQIERGTLDAVESLAKERDVAKSVAEDLKAKLDNSQKTVKRQDEDAERTQRIWESEKERWENERRQLERRVHVTESRLRTVVDEMGAQLAAAEGRNVVVEEVDESTFKDSGIGNESDTASVRSSTTPVKHRRNVSSLSSRRSVRNSTVSRTAGTPDPAGRSNGYSLADELGIDEEDEYDMDEFEHQDEELEYNEQLRRTMESRQSSVLGGETDSKAKRVLGLTSEIEAPIWSPTWKENPKTSVESMRRSEYGNGLLESAKALPTVEEAKEAPRVVYVDTGYQPSPPPSPPHAKRLEQVSVPLIQEPPPTGPDESQKAQDHVKSLQPLIVSKAAPSPISPPDTPVVDEEKWPISKRSSTPKPEYSSASTQTDIEGKAFSKGHTSNRHSLSPPAFVPSIAIHPPSSRPSSPRPYVLPPGTKNASTQASMPWACRDVAVQTEEIRIDRRAVKLPQHLLPKNLLPSPTFEEMPVLKPAKRLPTGGTAKIYTKNPPAPALPTPPLQSPVDESPVLSRDNSQKDLRSWPLRAIPLPRPVLAPALAPSPSFSDGPLNRSVQYGVTKAPQRSSQLLDMDNNSDASDGEDFVSDFDTADLDSSLSALSRPPVGRFGLSDPPRAVPEDKEISPERRPGTAGSYGAAPAPSVASSRAQSRQASHRDMGKAPAKRSVKDHRSRSPSFGSAISSIYSSQSAAPPYPIPTRSSSRVAPKPHSEGSQSPVPYQTDVFGNRAYRSHHHHHQPQKPGQSSRSTGTSNSLRKVQSAAVIRYPAPRKGGSPQKSSRRRQRRRSPDLTPVQSMAFESPMPTNFPIPELPTPLQQTYSFDYIKGSMDIGAAPTTVATTPRVSEETGIVDAIAGTMVGEWMWKYIRKRKSFGVQEDFPVSEDGSVKTAGLGSRHKRWVWLSPYERTIMWDSKQPASGTALLGKKGRKLAISSVLEVEDHTPLPKTPDLRTAYDRSILILTPARALKFTAINAERHLLWMRALSFLAESGNLPSQIPPMPSLPRPPKIPSDIPMPLGSTANAASIKRQRSPSFGRATVRDSIRLAKGKQRPPLPSSTTFPAVGTRSDAMLALEGQATSNEPSANAADDSADFPSVPRLYITTSRHQRKRSNTSPRLPAPLSTLRNFSSSSAGNTNTSSSHLAFPSSRPSGGSSKSGGSSLASPDRPNFFEAVGTVRMEAFVDPGVRNGVLYVPAPPIGGMSGGGVWGDGATNGAPAVGGAGRRKRGDSWKSQGKRREGFVFGEAGDPFKGF